MRGRCNRGTDPSALCVLRVRARVLIRPGLREDPGSGPAKPVKRAGRVVHPATEEVQSSMLTDTTAPVPTIRRIALERLVDELEQLDWHVQGDDGLQAFPSSHGGRR